jgi:hypothetical protein
MAPGVAAVCAGNSELYPGGREHCHVPRPDAFERSRILEYGAPCHISTLAVRRDLPVRFPTWTSYAEDILYYLDLLCQTRVAIAERPLVVYRIHAGGQTARPEMSERRDASLRRWLEINRTRVPPDELARLTAALRRREKWSLLSRALTYRKANRPLAALRLYAGVLLRSLFTPSSPHLVRSGFRSLLGAAAETLGVRRHPA